MHSQSVRYMDDVVSPNNVYIADFGVLTGDALKMIASGAGADGMHVYLNTGLRLMLDDGFPTLTVSHYSKQLDVPALQSFQFTETFMSATPVEMLLTYFGARVLAISMLGNKYSIFLDNCVRLLDVFMRCGNNYKQIISVAERMLVRKYPQSKDAVFESSGQAAGGAYKQAFWQWPVTVIEFASTLMGEGEKISRQMWVERSSQNVTGHDVCNEPCCQNAQDAVGMASKTTPHSEPLQVPG